MAWDIVIGLEVHVQLKTKSKLFSGSATAFGAKPNTQTSFIDAGLPGVLPVLNQDVVRMAIQFGLAIDANINQHSYFERKNYFYPDLPKGYQISQFAAPIVTNGCLTIPLSDGSSKSIEIVRAHLEEDAGKSLHESDDSYTGIDLNRAGTPLLEVVTSPCLYSAEEAVSYLRTLHRLVRFLGICDGNMQEGSFRCDVNLSLKPKGARQLGTRTELKNLNSFRFIEKAIAYETLRHQELLEQGQSIHQETRLYCPDTNTTIAMRSKENENDYRYFPDPDLLPIHINEEDCRIIKERLPILPHVIEDQLRQNTNLHDEDIQFVLASPAHWSFLNQIKEQATVSDKIIINWLRGPYLAALNEENLDFELPRVSATRLAPLLSLIESKKITANIAKQIFAKLWAGSDSVDTIMTQEGYGQTTDTADLEKMVKEVIANHPQQAADFKAGKEKLLAFFVGQIMKATKGQANPEQLNQLLRKHLLE